VTSRIRQLPDEVVNQIAAGEVVERPASVLKELLENAVDSGATRVEAEVSGSFPFELRVTDDGCGMTADEMALAVRRHTTSKISHAFDLETIGTFGFRGEALPSIASVSRLSVVSRPKGAAEGHALVVAGGETEGVRGAGAPPGTTVTVGDLFGNVPARRKFLKSPRTEKSHLRDVFHGVAIPREGLSFRFVDGRTLEEYEAGESRVDRARRHAGDEARYLVPVRGESAFFRVEGLAGLPQAARIGASGLHLFVNGRVFRDRSLLFALKEAYRGILPADRYPLVYLFIDCAPAEVDVNVHPAKTEVRFRYPRDLSELVRHSLAGALGEHGASPRPPVPGHGAYGHGPGEGYRPVSTGERFFPSSGELHPGYGPRGASPVVPFFPHGLPPRPARPAGEGGDPSAAPFPLPFGAGEEAPPAAVPGEGGFFSSLVPVGQLLSTFLVCEGRDEAILVDQHAAAERILFSRLSDAWLGEGLPLQRWLAPEELPFDGEAEAKEALLRFLERVGFEAEGTEGGVRVSGGPAILARFDVQGWWRDLLEFSEGGEGAVPKGIFDADRALWKMACHGSIRGGDRLDREGVRRLLADLDRASAAHSCPHGRPTWARLSRADLDRLFRRG
jgi:DNA mismatch repair protein MutL